MCPARRAGPSYCVSARKDLLGLMLGERRGVEAQAQVQVNFFFFVFPIPSLSLSLCLIAVAAFVIIMATLPGGGERKSRCRGVRRAASCCRRQFCSPIRRLKSRILVASPCFPPCLREGKGRARGTRTKA
jgi:hypothetical protein